MPLRRPRSLVAFLALVALLVPALGWSAPPEGWTSSRDNGIRHVRYAATARVAGVSTHFAISFQCDTTETADLHGVIGFDLTIDGVDRLAPFHFGEFEGPDATTAGKKLMAVKLVRKGQRDVTIEASPNGWTPEDKSFAFGYSAMTRVAASEPKTILKALRDGSESMEISIADPKDRKRALTFVVPVAGQEARFRELLTGVN